MRWLRNILDKVEPVFKKGGKLEKLYPIFEATDTILFSTDERTHSGPHIRDSIDVKRVMILVVVALIPCYIFGAMNVGYQMALALGETSTWQQNLSRGGLKILPIIVVTFAAGAFWELLFAVVRKHSVSEGFFSNMCINSTCDASNHSSLASGSCYNIWDCYWKRDFWWCWHEYF